MAVSSTVRPPRHGLPLPKFHSQVLTSYTLLPRLPSESEAAESAQPMPVGNPETLVLAELVTVWNCRGRVASQARKQGDEGDSAYHLVNWSHIKPGTELGQAMDGQVQLLKRAEKD